jgi:hypothetical protein
MEKSQFYEEEKEETVTVADLRTDNKSLILVRINKMAELGKVMGGASLE